MKQPLLKIIGLLRRIRKFLRAFFSSWYGDYMALVAIVLVSAFMVTFYTTGEPIVKSIANPAHRITFMGNILLMIPLSLIIATSIYALDRSERWRRNVVGRWIFQITALGLVLSLAAMHVVRLIYMELLHVDLFEMGYMERDFVVVMGSIILQHAYYKIRKVQQDRGVLRGELELHDAKVNGWKVKAEQLEMQVDEMQKQLVVLQDEHEDVKDRLIYSWKILEDMTQEISASYNEVDFIPLPVRLIAKAYFKNKGNDKVFYARTVNGKKVMLAINALSAMERLCPALLMKSTRSELVNLLAINDILSEEGKWYLDLTGAGLTEISKDQREKLLANSDKFKLWLEGTKELLNKDWNGNDKEDGSHESAAL